MNFKSSYEKVKWIVRKCQKEYYLHLWESSDWEQEGIEHDEEKLYRYFKTKFRNHIHDLIRKQESQKRKFDKQSYEEVSEIGHKLKAHEMFLDELVAFRELIAGFKAGLDPLGLNNYQRLIGNERFQGRKAMLRDLKEHLKEFRNNAIL